jgi:hypothetical protein
MSSSTIATAAMDVQVPPYADLRCQYDLTTMSWIVGVKVTALIHRWHTRRNAYNPYQVGTTTLVTDEPSVKMLKQILDKSLVQSKKYLELGYYDEQKYDKKLDAFVTTGKKIKFNDWLLTDKQYNILERK